MAELLAEDALATALAAVPAWSRQGNKITREFRFPSYLAGIEFVNQVAQLAEAANHHPDIHIGWRRVTLKVSTHSKGGLTELDFALARKIDVLIP